MNFEKLSKLIESEAFGLTTSIGNLQHFYLTNKIVTIYIYYYEHMICFNIFKDNKDDNNLEESFFAQNIQNKSENGITTFINSLRTSKVKQRNNIIKLLKENICTKDESWVKTHGM